MSAGSFGPLAATAASGRAASALSVPDDLAQLRGGGRVPRARSPHVRHGHADTITQFDDELQTIAGPLTDATDLTVGGRRLLAARPIT